MVAKTGARGYLKALLSSMTSNDCDRFRGCRNKSTSAACPHMSSTASMAVLIFGGHRGPRPSQAVRLSRPTRRSASGPKSSDRTRPPANRRTVSSISTGDRTKTNRERRCRLIERRQIHRSEGLVHAAFLVKLLEVEALALPFFGLANLRANQVCRLVPGMFHRHQRVRAGVASWRRRTGARRYRRCRVWIDRECRALIGAFCRHVQLDGRRPRVAAIGRPREHHQRNPLLSVDRRGA